MFSLDFTSNFSENQLLYIELEHQRYFGNYVSISKDKTRIELTNVRTGKDDPGTNRRMIFYRSEVQSIKSDQQPVQEEDTSSEPSQPVVEKKSITTIAYTYITEFRADYHAAIADLQNQDFVGLNMEGKTLLVIAVNQKVYLFDMRRLGRLRADLKELLEANSPLKVVHNGSHISKRMQKYDCELNAVFDTASAHSKITDCENPISVEMCVNLYLGTELPVVDAVLDDVRLEDQLLIAANRVAHLVMLFDCLVHDVMLKALSVSSQKYVESLSKIDDRSNAGNEIRSGENPAIGMIEHFEKLYVL